MIMRWEPAESRVVGIRVAVDGGDVLRPPVVGSFDGRNIDFDESAKKGELISSPIEA
jgi:hypothetical protein